MRKIIITNGLIAGAIVSLMQLISIPLMRKGILNFDNGMWVGYASMLLALSTIFFGIKTFRDQYQEGIISFGKAFQIGILIALVAAVLYAISWEVYYDTIGGDFMEQYSRHYVDKLKSQGASDTALQAAQADMSRMSELYKNPVVRFGFTMLEISPVGIVITLVSAAILRKREILPA
jgi:hypothetical protein